MALNDIQLERRLLQMEADTNQAQSHALQAVGETAQLKGRVDWLLIVSIFGSTASVVLSLVVFVLLLQVLSR